jgi:hypothetical protein
MDTIKISGEKTSKIPSCVNETDSKSKEILIILEGLTVDFAKHILKNVERKVECNSVINSQSQ